MVLEVNILVVATTMVLEMEEVALRMEEMVLEVMESDLEAMEVVTVVIVTTAYSK